MSLSTDQVKQVALAVRTLSIDAVEKANSGHPGLPLGAADFATLLWANYLRFDPQAPEWVNRDRFILSAGHGCALVYSLLHLFGYPLSLDDLKSFRQWGSKTPGHPEFGVTVGVEATTGPLGQGGANAVGMALSSKLLAERYSKELFSHRVFALVSDGDMMEGVNSEAASMAGHLGLDNLIWLYDDNQISLAGATSLCFTESVAKRFEGYGWSVQTVNGHDLGDLARAYEAALVADGKPKLICCRTTIGFGSPHKAGNFEVHGAPLGKDEVRATKERLGAPPDKEFFVPEAVRELLAKLVESKKQEYRTWQSKFEAWSKAQPKLAAEFLSQAKREIPTALKTELLATFKEPKKDATRNLSSAALQVIAKHVPYLVGGSADLDPSTKTAIKGSPEVQRGESKGRNVRFGVREHGMGAVVNGLAYQKCWIPYSATFLTFSDYMRPTLRLAALSELQSLFIFTHESFYLGEDGPTHQPVEHAMTLRAIPHMKVWRPADGIEVAMSYYAALTHHHGPSTLLFTRQNLAPLPRSAEFNPDDVLKGAYVVSGHSESAVAVVATGSEVSLAVEAAKLLESQGTKVRVISMPSVETFLSQPSHVRDAILPPAAMKISIEAGITWGWERVVGSNGLMIGLDRFGASAPAEVLAEQFGFTPSKVAERVKSFLTAH